MIIEYENYQVRPYSNNLCWEIFEYRPIKDRETKEVTREDWVSLGVYPDTLGNALETIYERVLKLDSSHVSLKEALDTAKRISKALRASKERARNGGQ